MKWHYYDNFKTDYSVITYSNDLKPNIFVLVSCLLWCGERGAWEHVKSNKCLLLCHSYMYILTFHNRHTYIIGYLNISPFSKVVWEKSAKDGS